MNILSRLDLSPINFELPLEGTVGVMLSGGLDSAVLLSLISKEISENKLPINVQVFTVPKFDGSINQVDSITSYISKRFDVKILPKIVVGDPTLYHRSQNESGIKEVLTTYKSIKQLFIGINRNPPPEFKLSGTYPDRVSSSDHPNIEIPFVNLYKTHIVDLIYQFSLEELLNITHTCTEQQKGRCGKCFQCSERQWAFEQLGKVDTGII